MAIIRPLKASSSTGGTASGICAAGIGRGCSINLRLPTCANHRTRIETLDAIQNIETPGADVVRATVVRNDTYGIALVGLPANVHSAGRLDQRHHAQN